MPYPTRPPLDLFPYAPDPSSEVLTVGIAPASYAYVMTEDGLIQVVPDAPHRHPKILGGGLPAAAAGELIVETAAVVTLVNNLSGTFQCPPESVDWVVAELKRLGFTLSEGAEKKYPLNFF